MAQGYTVDKATGKRTYTKESIKQHTEYNKANYSDISFTMKPDDYELFKAAADRAGIKFATWVKQACKLYMDR